MNKILKDPIKARQKTQDGQKEWSYKAPSYDNRTSCSISAGDNYGVGFNAPLGKEKAGPITSGPIPMMSKAFSCDMVMKREDVQG